MNRDTEKVSLCWFTLHMPTVGRDGPRAEPGVQFRSVCVSGTQLFQLSLLLPKLWFSKKLGSGAWADNWTQAPLWDMGAWTGRLPSPLVIVYFLVRLSRRGPQYCCADRAHVQYELVYVPVTDLVSGFYYGWLSCFYFCVVSVSGLLKALRLKLQRLGYHKLSFLNESVADMSTKYDFLVQLNSLKKKSAAFSCLVSFHLYHSSHVILRTTLGGS